MALAVVSILGQATVEREGPSRPSFECPEGPTTRSVPAPPQHSAAPEGAGNARWRRQRHQLDLVQSSPVGGLDEADLPEGPLPEFVPGIDHIEMRPRVVKDPGRPLQVFALTDRYHLVIATVNGDDAVAIEDRLSHSVVLGYLVRLASEETLDGTPSHVDRRGGTEVGYGSLRNNRVRPNDRIRSRIAGPQQVPTR